jgi:predicted CXXCH cytochrome family protein
MAAIPLVVTSGLAFAFHDGGVAACNGCHVTHASEDGVPTVDPNRPALLNEATASEVCLSCHAHALGAVLGLDPLFPPPEKGGGNFVFLFEDNLNDAVDGATNPIAGDAAGHNIDAPSYGLTFDARYSLAPGGTFPANQMSCTSCHDPHGNADFRLLRGSGETVGGTVFSRPAPRARGTALDPGPESPVNHTAYLDGMSEWCANCHGADYHETGGSVFEHPGARTLGAVISNRYNEYDGVNSPTGGTTASAYLPEVPFEDTSNSIGSSMGPSASSRLICLSCHRAHATSAPAAGRWDFNVTRLDDDGLASGSYPLPNPYGDPDQGSLCAKCHGTVSGGGPPPTTAVPPAGPDPTSGTFGGG